MRFLQADYHPVYAVSPCSSLDSGPSYNILDLADVADAFVANSTSQCCASRSSSALISMAQSLQISHKFYIFLSCCLSSYSCFSVISHRHHDCFGRLRLPLFFQLSIACDVSYSRYLKVRIWSTLLSLYRQFAAPRFFSDHE